MASRAASVAEPTHLLTLSVQVVDGLAGSIGSRTHQDDHAVGILSSIIREEVILTTSDLRELAQILLNHLGNCIVVGVAGLTVCEEGLGVLSSTTGDRTLRRHSTVAETLDVLFLHERTDILLVEQLNLVILVRGAETVEEVNERYAGLERSQVSSGSHIHHLLYRTLAEHSETSLTASHHVLMVTEDTQRVRSQRTGRNVEHAGNQLAGNLVHVRNHQEQTLRGGKCRGEGTSLQRTVNGTGSTSL